MWAGPSPYSLMPEPVRFTALVNPTPKQREFWRATDAHAYTLYGGARGGGKSRILRWSLVRYLLQAFRQGHRNVRVALFCEDYPSLQDRQISKVEVEFPAWLGVYHASQHEFRLAPAFGSGVICFRNLDNPSKYQSAEFAAIAVDELTKNPLSTFNTLRGSLRWPGLTHLPFMAATNPGDVGHIWVRDYWIDRRYPPELEPLADQFAFVRSLPSDNPHLGAEYWATLNSLPDALRKAWVEGSWDAFEGQYFDEWSDRVHTVEPFPIPADWEVEGGMDWGYAPSPGVVGWVAFDPFGRAWGYKELVYDRSSPREVADMIAARCVTDAERRMLIRGDTQMWTPQPDRGVSIAQEINDRLAELDLEVTLVQANKDRLNGWAMVHQHLLPRPGPEQAPCPWFRAFTPDKTGLGMPYLIRTLPAQTHSDTRPGDLKKGETDHAADMLRYLLIARPPLTALSVAPLPSHTERVHQRTQRLLKQVRERRARELGVATSLEAMAVNDEGDVTGYDRDLLDDFVN